jgi:hypothetical protein
MHISSKVATAVILGWDEIRYSGATSPVVAERTCVLVTLADIFDKVVFEWRNEGQQVVDKRLVGVR